MAALKIENIHTLVTMDAENRELHGVDVVMEEGRIAAVGESLPTPEGARVLDGSSCVAYPGFVNTHHHFYQALTRNLPSVQDAKLFDWLTWLYEVWRGLNPENVRISTQVALSELLLSGCTTTTDHFYCFPRSAPKDLLDVEIDEARRMGVRFHATRGSMSLATTFKEGRTEACILPDLETARSCGLWTRDRRGHPPPPRAQADTRPSCRHHGWGQLALALAQQLLPSGHITYYKRSF